MDIDDPSVVQQRCYPSLYEHLCNLYLHLQAENREFYELPIIKFY